MRESWDGTGSIGGADRTSEAVAAHYDDLDVFYREVWGEHVHHGLWRTGREDVSTAVRQLVVLVAEKARATGARVCDVGCGYGATARMLATEYHAQVTGLTVSRKQYAYAQAVDPDASNPVYLQQDWLANTLPDASFDTVVAIESLAHMADKAAFFRQARRVLRSEGRLVVCAWLTGDRARRWQKRWLLEPICREGRLPGMGTAADYQRLLEDAGFAVDEVDDLTLQVRKTWSVCMRRVVRGLLTRRVYRRFLFDRAQPNRVFSLTVPRIWLAYRTGGMGYALFAARKP
ncbi:MAG: class I SAM-dependent methyltransferase [Rhodothermales bacterium]